ncbi:hypothetical protein ACHAXT_006969 [Thalassiosira profunda]
MKILHLPSFAALALSWVFGIAAAETSTCDESMFGDASQVIDGSVNDIMIKVVGPCEEFQMPRITFTIEPSPEGDNTTSVYASPSDVGSVVYEYSSITGVEINAEAAMNAAEVGILIQTPRDTLGSVQVEMGASFNVNIAKGFTALTYLSVWGGDTCSYGFDGCPLPECDDLYKSEELSGIGPSVVADLSDVNVVSAFSDNTTFVRPIWVTASYGSGIYDLTLSLPDYEGGVPAKFSFGAGLAKIAIIGDLDCGYVPEREPNDPGFCTIESTAVPGCKDCMDNELVIDGTIAGFFNVSSATHLDVQTVEEDGCDHFAPFNNAENSGKFQCDEGPVEVDATPFPCVGDAGSVVCGGPNPYGYENQCLCLVPLPEDGSCNSPVVAAGSAANAKWVIFGTSAVAVFIVSLGW